MRSRPSVARKVEDSRWVKDKRGHWRYVTDEVTEVDFCFRRREKAGWYRGARVTRR